MQDEIFQYGRTFRYLLTYRRYFRSLRSLLDYEEDDIENVFGLAFVISLSLLGDSKDIELKTNGGEIAVNQSNKHEFVQVFFVSLAFTVQCNQEDRP